ncbi:alpha/beta hydrolase [Pendulispora brunnea]|uniref:Alpha/beta hydrolase n=1 Tax=Pendulispora brunnea TaxID=2905690 RepID=A0ABZ2KRH7_9BACT
MLSRFAFIFLIVLALVACRHQEARTPPHHEVSFVRTPDGVRTAVQTWGNPKGRPIVFVHGLAQSHLSWTRQVASSLGDEFRLVTYDLRGHGDSDKPLDARYYEEGRRWGEELAAVLDTLGPERPVVVGWSLGGVVIANYLAAHGDARLGGIVLVAAVTTFDRALLGVMPPLASPDLATRIGANRQFLRDCFAVPPTGEEFETMLAYNAQVPREVFAAVPHVSLDGTDAAFARVKVPVLVLQGSEDKLVKMGMAKRSAALVPGSHLAVYEGVGHAPFYERADAFNGDLAAFARRAVME